MKVKYETETAGNYAKRAIDLFLKDPTGGMIRMKNITKEGTVTITKISNVHLRLDFNVIQEKFMRDD